MLPYAGVLTVVLIASQIEPREDNHQALPPAGSLLSAHLTLLSDEREDWRVRHGLATIGGGAATLAVGTLVAHETGAPPEFLAVPLIVGGGLITFGVVRLCIPTDEEDLARRYHSAIQYSDGVDVDVERFENEWKALVEQERAGRDVLAGAWVISGVTGIAASAYLAITTDPSTTLYVSTAATALLGMSGTAYGVYLWKFFQSPIERTWRTYLQSRTALVKAPVPQPVTPPVTLAVDVQPNRAMLVIAGRF